MPKKIDIKISKSRLENQWITWTKNQLKKEAIRNGLLLQELLNLDSNEDQTLDNLSCGQICDFGFGATRNTRIHSFDSKIIRLI